MTVDNEAIKNKLRKLLALANDPAAFEGEKGNALRFARRLMVQHNITKESIGENPRDRAKTASEFEYSQQFVYTFGRDMSKWEGTLLHAITELVGSVQHYRTSEKVPKMNDHGGIEKGPRGEDRTVTKLVYYGPTQEAKDAVELHNEWVYIIVAMARLKYGSYVRGGARSYCEGFAYGLFTQVKKIQQEEKQSTSRDLVLVGANQLMDAKRQFALEWLKQEQNVKLKKSRAHANRGDDSREWEKGLEDGKRSQFTKEKVLKVGNK